MARKSAPTVDPLPSVGGDYLLDESTGKWILQCHDVEQPAPAPDADPVNTNDDGTDSEAPAAGED
jgi:hypothetical protein